MVVSELLRFIRLHFPFVGKKRRLLEKPVIISLTSTQARIGKIRPCLRSLLDQSVPTRIVLNLPSQTHGTSFILPDFREFEYIKINWISHDLGPATKLLPTLSLVDENTMIIVLDDDQVYPKNLVQSYLKAEENIPNSAYTLCGWRVPGSKKHHDKYILHGAGLRLFNPKANLQNVCKVDVIQGASSYALKRKQLPDDVANFENAPEGAKYADDIWISGQLARNGTDKWVIKSNSNYCRLLSLPHLRTVGLRDTANAGNTNNNNLYNHFAHYWMKN